MSHKAQTTDLPAYFDRDGGSYKPHPFGIDAYQLVLHKQDGTTIERIFPNKEAAQKWNLEQMAAMPRVDWAAERRWRDKYVCTRKD